MGLCEHHDSLGTLRAAGDRHRHGDANRRDLQRREINGRGGICSAVEVAQRRTLGGTGASASGPGQHDQLVVLGFERGHDGESKALATTGLFSTVLGLPLRTLEARSVPVA